MSVGTPTGTKVAVVLSHPTQYYSPWLQWIVAHTGLTIKVFYLWDFGVTEQVDPKFGTAVRWDLDLLSGYEHEFVPNTSRNPGAEYFFGFNNPDLVTRLSRWRPDTVLVFGYKWASHLRAFAWARMHCIPIIFRGDSNLIGRPRQPLHVTVSLRVLFSQMAAFLYVGSANRDYFARFGVPQEKLFFCPHSVSSDLYKPSPEHREESQRLRQQLGISPRTSVVLFAGKLVPAKQPMELLRAFLDLGREDTVLVFVGEGSEKAALQAAAGAHSPYVHFLPFANQTQMPSRYLMADLFALPSRGIWETWGLAVNEAMHMGVPCLVSDRVGSQRDLVTDGETGWVFDPEDPRALKDALSRAFSDIGSQQRHEAILANVSARISGFTYERATQGLLEAVAAVTA